MTGQSARPVEFRAPVTGGELVGWVGGRGPELLLLHGGPSRTTSNRWATNSAMATAWRRTSTRHGSVNLGRAVMEGVATDEEAQESFRIFWPAYFPTPDRAPECPDIRVNAASAGPTLQSAVAELPGLASRLEGAQVPTVFVHGAASPMPVTASTDTAEVMGAAASVVVVPDAGHFIWMDVPGCLRPLLDRLVERVMKSPHGH